MVIGHMTHINDNQKQRNSHMHDLKKPFSWSYRTTHIAEMHTCPIEQMHI